MPEKSGGGPLAPAEDDICAILRKSRTLREHLDLFGRLEPAALGPARLQKWIDASSGGDPETFARLTSFDDPTATDAPGAEHPRAGNEMEFAWGTLLGELLRDLEHGSAVPQAKAYDRHPAHANEEEAGPWHPFFAPLLESATARVRTRLGGRWDELSADVQGALKHDLLRSLLNVSRGPLKLELQLARVAARSAAARLLAEGGGGEQLQHLVRKLQADGGIVRLWREYPVLARLAAVVIGSWIEATAELIDRIHEDWSEIQRTFGGDGAPVVVSIQPSLSDRHNGGRSVAVIRFTTGVRIVYKPRNLQIEIAYNSFLHWINACRPPLPLRTYRVINRDTHGWAEFVAAAPPDGADATARFFHRCGMLLCVAHVLGATDLHCENLIANGEYPMLVDVETLMHPDVREVLPPGLAVPGALYDIWQSVLRTGLLPQFNPGEDDWRWKVAGISSALSLDEDGSSGGRPSRDWQAPLRTQWENVVGGFETLYSLLLEHRETLLNADGPLGVFSGCEIRFVFRATRHYADLLRYALQPDCLETGVDLGIALERLNRVGMRFPERPLFWPLIAAERQALTNLDIPHFRTRTDLVDLQLPTGDTLDDFFVRSGFERAWTSIAELGDDDRQRQVNLLAGALLSRITCIADQAPSPVCRNDGGSSVRASLFAAALAIGSELLRRSVRLHGRMTWISPTFSAAGINTDMRVLPYDLYSGSHGVGLFLAALETVEANQGFADAARDALSPEQFTGPGPAPGLGACSGWGSQIYSHTRIAQLLDDSGHIRLARRSAEAISDSEIRGDKHYDVFSGSAGAILGLLAFYGATRESWVLERAVRCAMHLVENRTVDRRSGLRAWNTSRGRMLSGFSHGAAGISYALLCLHRATGDRAYREVAAEAIAYENTRYVADLGNWSDAGEPDRERGPLCTWCHGAPGIGLARLGGLDRLDTPQVRADIDAAVECVLDYPVERLDHLCCGNLGRVEFLFTAGRKLKRPELEVEALRRATEVLNRARERRAFGYGITAFVPGLFQGASGVGYQFLRLACPTQQFPSLLLWE